MASITAETKGSATPRVGGCGCLQWIGDCTDCQDLLGEPWEVTVARMAGRPLPAPPRLPTLQAYPVPDVVAPRHELARGTWAPEAATVPAPTMVGSPEAARQTRAERRAQRGRLDALLRIVSWHPAPPQGPASATQPLSHGGDAGGR